MKQNESPKRTITRRQFHGLGAVAVLAATAPWLVKPGRARADSKLVTEIPENEVVLKGIQFVSTSEKEGQQCANCLLYQPGEGGRGRCQILPRGVVPAEAWCLSWSPRP